MVKRASLVETAKAAKALKTEGKSSESAGPEPSGDISVMDIERGPKLQLSLRIDENLIERLRDCAWWERQSIVDAVDTALRGYIHDLEVKRGSP